MFSFRTVSRSHHLVVNVVTLGCSSVDVFRGRVDYLSCPVEGVSLKFSPQARRQWSFFVQGKVKTSFCPIPFILVIDSVNNELYSCPRLHSRETKVLSPPRHGERRSLTLWETIVVFSRIPKLLFIQIINYDSICVLLVVSFYEESTILVVEEIWVRWRSTFFLLWENFYYYLFNSITNPNLSNTIHIRVVGSRRFEILRVRWVEEERYVFRSKFRWKTINELNERLLLKFFRFTVKTFIYTSFTY